MTPDRRRFLILCAAAIVLRVVLTVTTLGSNDARFNTLWVQIAQQHGIADAYGQTAMMNHPPLSLALMLMFARISAATGMPYIHVFRLFQIAADGLAAWALFQTGGRRFALFVLLSPAAAFVSAFHCNTDPTMIALVVTAAALLIQGRSTAAGLVLALASGIKILPFLLAPLFFLYVPRGRRSAFTVAFTAAAIAIFVPAIVAGGPLVAKHVFGYRGGLPYEWGLPGIAFATSRLLPGLRDIGEWIMTSYVVAGRYVAYAAIAAVTAFVAWRRSDEPRAVLHASALMFLAILAVAPGFGVQYIAWIIPLLPFALSWRSAVWMNAAASVFLFVTYTVWSGGLPWWFADVARPGPYRWMAAVAGYLMWIAVCTALVSSARRYGREHPPRRSLRTTTEDLQPSPGIG